MKKRLIPPRRGGFRNITAGARLPLTAAALLAGVFFWSALATVQARESEQLTGAEREWLATHSQIVLAPDPEFQPVEYFDEKGEYRGIAADYVALLGKRLGIRFKPVRLRNWDEVLDKARDREVDMFGAAAQTPLRSEFMLFTRPYLEFPAVIIVRKDVTKALTLKLLRGMKVAVVSGYAVHDHLRLNHPELKLDVVPDIQTGLRKVSFGMADAFIGNLATASFHLEREGITNLRVAGESGYVYRLALATRKDWPILHGILEKGLAGISKEERETIYRRWIRLRPESLLAMKKFWLASLGILAAAALGLAGVAAWNRSLKKQVAQKTGKLLETTELLENIIANIPIYVFWKNNDFRYLGCNQRFASVAGVGRKENIAGKTDYDLAWRREDVDLIRQSDRNVMENKEPLLEIEETLLQADGHEATFLTSKVPLEDDAGKVIGLLGICTDITLRKRDEEALAESEALLRVIFDETLSLMGLMKPDGTLIKINRTAADSIQAEVATVLGKPFWETPWWNHAPEQQNQLRDAIKRAAQGEFVRFETNHPKPEGGLVHLDFSIKPVKDEQGKVTLLVPEGRDITDRKQAEEALKEALAKARKPS